MAKKELVFKSNPHLESFEDFKDGYNKVLFFDENGSASQLKSIEKLLANGKNIDEKRRYFTLTGVLFDKKSFKDAVSLLNQLTKQYWSQGERVVYHTREIQRREGVFNFYTNRKYNRFLGSLSTAIDLMNFRVISITFDLYSYATSKKYVHDPYTVAFDIILETIMRILHPRDKVALVFEARGKKEDKSLREHILKVIDSTGTKKYKRDDLKLHFDKVFFNPKVSYDGKIVYHGTDIADLCSYPLFRYMTTGFRGQDFEIVKTKLIGYKPELEPDFKKIIGLRYFPKEWKK